MKLVYKVYLPLKSVAPTILYENLIDVLFLFLVKKIFNFMKILYEIWQTKYEMFSLSYFQPIILFNYKHFQSIYPN